MRWGRKYYSCIRHLLQLPYCSVYCNTPRGLYEVNPSQGALQTDPPMAPVSIFVVGDLELGRLLPSGGVDPEPFSALNGVLLEADWKRADIVLCLGNFFAEHLPPVHVVQLVIEILQFHFPKVLAPLGRPHSADGGEEADIRDSADVVRSRLFVLGGASDGMRRPGALDWLARVGLVNYFDRAARYVSISRPGDAVDAVTTRVCLYMRGHDLDLDAGWWSFTGADGGASEFPDDSAFNVLALHQRSQAHPPRFAPSGPTLRDQTLAHVAAKSGISPDIVFWGGKWSNSTADDLMGTLETSFDPGFAAVPVTWTAIYPGRATKAQQSGRQTRADVRRGDQAVAVLLRISGENYHVTSIRLQRDIETRAEFGQLLSERHPGFPGTIWCKRDSAAARAVETAISAPLGGSLLRASPGVLGWGPTSADPSRAVLRDAERVPADRRAGGDCVELTEDMTSLVILSVATLDVEALSTLARVSRRVGSLVNRVWLQLLLGTRGAFLQTLALRHVSTRWSEATRRRDMDEHMLWSLRTRATVGVRGYIGCLERDADTAATCRRA